MPRFTVPFIRGLRPDPGGKDVMHFDGRIPGFGVRVKPSGVKTYFLKYRDPYGHQRKVSIGPVHTPDRRDGLDPGAALKKARKMRAAVDDGRDPAAEAAGLRNAKTVAQLCDEHLKASSNSLKPSTFLMERSRIENHVKPLLGSRAVASLKPEDMEKFLADIAAGKSIARRSNDKPIKGGVARGGMSQAVRTLEMLGTILERRAVPDILASNPVRKVRRPKSKPVKPPFSFAKVKALGQAMRKLEAEGEATVGLRAIRFLLLSGFRRMEALTLQWGAVDASAHCARLADTKTGPQTRPLGRAAINGLARFKPEGAKPKAYVFPGEGKAGHYIGAPKAWGRIAKRAKISDMSLHGLRHWYASAAAELNFSELVIAALLGHSVRTVTGRYATAPDSALVAAADRISLALARALDDTTATSNVVHFDVAPAA